MGFVGAMRSVLRQYASPSGRACRSEYWYWTLAVTIVALIVGVLEETGLAPGFSSDGPYVSHRNGPLTIVFYLVTFLPSLTVSIRRLHDIDKSGWWLLINLVPLFGYMSLLYLAAKRGMDGPNQFGPDPLGFEGGHTDQMMGADLHTKTYGAPLRGADPAQPEASPELNHPSETEARREAKRETQSRPERGFGRRQSVPTVPSVRSGRNKGFQTTQDRFRKD